MDLKPLTRVQLGILRALSDGLPHHKSDLKACLYDEMAEDGAVRKHICDIRKHVKLKGRDICHTFIKGRCYYILVKLLRK